MLFCSYAFLAFFAAVFLVYWSLPWRQARVGLLVVASFAFYATWNHWLALLVFASTAVDYWLALALDRVASPRGRRLIVVGSVLMNLGLLVYFKYANFFLQSLGDALHAVGGASAMPLLQVIAPMGISFYTFEAINYMVDVYRRKIPAERNLGHFLLFITFFPHLLAGPIVRARDFLPQIHRAKRWSGARFWLGGQFVLMGLFKKMVVADHMALITDPVFANPGAYGTCALWLAALAYALQIYGDFSGYSDLAVGAAHMLGYKLAPNFNMPYLAANIAEFWRRWHISLSSWLRDYLFIPLGGSRGSRWQTCRNLLIVMTLGGLWHGASWTFLVWGAYHGLLLVAQRFWRGFCERRAVLRRAVESTAGTALCMGTTFLAVCVGWILFRAATFAAAGTMLLHMFTLHSGAAAPSDPLRVWQTVAVLALCHWLAASGLWKRFGRRLPAPIRGLGYVCLLLLVLVLVPMTTTSFIYFQF